MPAPQPRPTLAERLKEIYLRLGFTARSKKAHRRLAKAELRRRARKDGFSSLVELFDVPDFHPTYLLSWGKLDYVIHVRDILASASAPHEEICALLRELDWRAHIVALTGAVLGFSNEKVVDELWRAADCGSWVSPQLIAAAYLVDPHFVDAATDRLKTGFAISPERKEGVDALSLHVMTGPVGSHHLLVSAKAMSALVYCCRQLPEITNELRGLLNSDSILRLVSADVDHGGEIAEDFLESVRNSGYFPGPAAVR